MRTLFGGVHAPSAAGTLLRKFTFGHARQLESVLREHLVALCGRVDLLPGADQQVFIDIDSLLRPVYGHAKEGAPYGHTKIAGKQILRKGLSPYRRSSFSMKHWGGYGAASGRYASPAHRPVAVNILRNNRIRPGLWWPRVLPCELAEAVRQARRSV
jgi:hypothetical protein